MNLEKKKEKERRFQFMMQMNLGRKREIYVEKLFQFEDTQQKKMEEVFYISLLHYFIYSMVSFQLMENGVQEDMKIHFVSTLNVKKKHAEIEKSENSETG